MPSIGALLRPQVLRAACGRIAREASLRVRAGCLGMQLRSAQEEPCNESNLCQGSGHKPSVGSALNGARRVFPRLEMAGCCETVGADPEEWRVLTRDEQRDAERVERSNCQERWAGASLKTCLRSLRRGVLRQGCLEAFRRRRICHPGRKCSATLVKSQPWSKRLQGLPFLSQLRNTCTKNVPKNAVQGRSRLCGGGRCGVRARVAPLLRA